MHTYLHIHRQMSLEADVARGRCRSRQMPSLQRASRISLLVIDLPCSLAPRRCQRTPAPIYCHSRYPPAILMGGGGGSKKKCRWEKVGRTTNWPPVDEHNVALPTSY
jgi:hypothetical protein